MVSCLARSESAAIRTTARAAVPEGPVEARVTRVVSPDDDAVVMITTKVHRKRRVTRRIRDSATAATRHRVTRGYRTYPRMKLSTAAVFTLSCGLALAAAG